MILVAVLAGLGLATLAVLVVTAISLAKQGARLASSVAAFQKEVRPLLEQIRSDADRVGDRLEKLQAPPGDAPGSPPSRRR